jgi:dipeptidyl aminopeptidase/acylaminoacyl peptidase
VRVFLAAVVLSASIFCGVEHDPSQYKIQAIHFKSQEGRFDIAASLYLPSNKGKYPLLIFVHGSGPAQRSFSRGFLEFMQRFHRAGFACLYYDKPGFGQSSGEFRDNHLFEDRAAILLEAVNRMKKHPNIRSDRIGFWGISQAGYVMPLALEKSEDIAFMIAVSCPGTDSANQSAFLVRAQHICEGHGEEEAEKAYKYFIQRLRARNYVEYSEAAAYLVDNPIMKSLDWGQHVKSEEEFSPYPPASEVFFDPMPLIARHKIPVLAIFGDKDKNIDPFQGFEAYRKAIQAAGHPLSEVKMFDGAGHTLRAVKTGCMNEMRELRRSGRRPPVVPGYFEIQIDWLKRLAEHWEQNN